MKDRDNFREKYDNDLRGIISDQVALMFADVFLVPYIDLFSAYFAENKVIREIYIETEN